MKLWRHQSEAVDRALQVDNYALFFEMGTGKSACVIEIMKHKMHGNSAIILAPKIVLAQWKQEISKFWPSFNPDRICCLGYSKNRCLEIIDKALATKEPHIFIANYEKLRTPEIFRRFLDLHANLIVADESHLLKSPTSKRTRLAIKLADQADHKYLLTGTPILNSALDLWAQFRFLDGGATFGDNYPKFRAKYFYDKNIHMPRRIHFPDWRMKASSHKEITRLMYKTAMRVMKEECLDLPPIIRQTVDVELSTEQKRLYREMKVDFLTSIVEEPGSSKFIVAEVAVTKLIRLQQIVAGHVKTEDGTVIRINANPRQLAVEELVQSLPPLSKVIIWCNFRKDFEIIREVANKLKIAHVEIHGGVAQEQRELAINLFQNNDSVRIMIANQQAAGLGVNLTEASYSIYYSKSYRWGDDIQSESRNHRGGSEKHDHITRIDLVARDTVDEIINEALAAKSDLSELLLKVKDEI